MNVHRDAVEIARYLAERSPFADPQKIEVIRRLPVHFIEERAEANGLASVIFQETEEGKPEPDHIEVYVPKIEEKLVRPLIRRTGAKPDLVRLIVYSLVVLHEYYHILFNSTKMIEEAKKAFPELSQSVLFSVLNTVQDVVVNEFAMSDLAVFLGTEIRPFAVFTLLSLIKHMLESQNYIFIDTLEKFLEQYSKCISPEVAKEVVERFWKSDDIVLTHEWAFFYLLKNWKCKDREMESDMIVREGGTGQGGKKGESKEQSKQGKEQKKSSTGSGGGSKKEGKEERRRGGSGKRKKQKGESKGRGESGQKQRKGEREESSGSGENREKTGEREQSSSKSREGREKSESKEAEEQEGEYEELGIGRSGGKSHGQKSKLGQEEQSPVPEVQSSEGPVYETGRAVGSPGVYIPTEIRRKSEEEIRVRKILENYKKELTEEDLKKILRVSASSAEILADFIELAENTSESYAKRKRATGLTLESFAQSLSASLSDYSLWTFDPVEENIRKAFRELGLPSNVKLYGLDEGRAVPTVIWVVDISGSVSEKLLENLLAVIAGVDQSQLKQYVVVFSNYALSTKQESDMSPEEFVELVEKMIKKIRGGGTNIVSAMKAVNKILEEVDSKIVHVVILSDFEFGVLSGDEVAITPFRSSKVAVHLITEYTPIAMAYFYTKISESADELHAYLLQEIYGELLLTELEEEEVLKYLNIRAVRPAEQSQFP